MQLLTGQEFATRGSSRCSATHPSRTRACSSVLLHQGEPEVPGRLPGQARARERPVVLPRLGRRLRRPADRGLPAAGRPAHQEALPRAAVRRRRDRRARVPRTADLLRRALPGPRRRGAAAVLRPAAGGLRRAPAHGRAVHPPDRRGEQPARARPRDRRGPHHHRQRRRDPARLGHHRRRHEAAVDAFTKNREVLHREGIGGLASATLPGLDASGRRAAADAGLELTPVSLQQLIVRSTTSGIEEK